FLTEDQLADLERHSVFTSEATSIPASLGCAVTNGETGESANSGFAFLRFS
ncbi:MAG: hypothetical protein JWN30_2123, partial [Bacilli bacterium]|nr:hypothetical protein [Bacilli bacterium]